MNNTNNFIFDSVKGRKKYIVLYYFSILIKDIFSLFVAQYIYKYIINSIIENKLDLKLGIFYIGLFAFILSFNVLFLVFNKIFQFNSLNYIQKNVRNKLFKYVIQHSMGYFNDTLSGAVNEKINTIVNEFKSLLKNSSNFLRVIVAFLVISIVYLLTNKYLFLFFIVFTFFYVSSFYVMRKSLVNKSKAKAESKSRYFGLINDAFINIVNIKTFGSEKRELNIIKRQNFDILRKSSEYLYSSAYSVIGGGIFTLVFILLTMGFPVYMLAKNVINLGDFLFFIGVTSIFIWYLKIGVDSVINIFESHGKIENGINTIFKSVSINNKENAKVLNNINGKILFRHINFWYGSE